MASFACRVCDSTSLELAIDLGEQPWANDFLTKEQVGKEPFYPLRVVFCRDCTTLQLDHTVAKETMFGNHTYLSGVTKTLDEHFKKMAEEVDERFFKERKEKSVLDIGSNDGTQHKHYKALGYDVVGVESSANIAERANSAGVHTIPDFFNLDLVREHGLEGKFDVINASGVFFHLEELHSVTDGVREALKKDGVFVVQFLYTGSIIENKAFDQIYHEHLLYYTLRSIQTLLMRHGLSLFDAYLSPIHGGSMIAYITHADNAQPSERLKLLQNEESDNKLGEFDTYLQFAKTIEVLKAENREYFDRKKKEGKSIYGFGAPVKGNTLLNYFKIGTDYIDYLVERNPLRKGLYSPGTHIPIILEEEVTELPDVYYVLAWNFKKEILSRNQGLIDKGVEFFFPINPKMEI